MPPTQNAHLRIFNQKRKIIVKSSIIMITTWFYHQSKPYHLLRHPNHDLWVMMTHQYPKMTHKVMKTPETFKIKYIKFLIDSLISSGQPTYASYHKNHDLWLMMSHQPEKMTKNAMKTPETLKNKVQQLLMLNFTSDGQPTCASYYENYELWLMINHKYKNGTKLVTKVQESLKTKVHPLVMFNFISNGQPTHDFIHLAMNHKVRQKEL